VAFFRARASKNGDHFHFLCHEPWERQGLKSQSDNMSNETSAAKAGLTLQILCRG
jgi:hypothetical protein